MTEFREIVVLGSPRSGSNLLCSILRDLPDNIGFFEILAKDRIEGLQWHPAVEARVAASLTVPGATADSAELIAARDSDPVAFFDALSKGAREAGARSITCKIFDHQISIPHLDAILRRPNLRVIFLSRRRIDRFISAEKARISGKYLQANTTETRPLISTLGFLKEMFQDDHQLEAMYRSVRTAGVPYSYLNYERDLDIDQDQRKARISDALVAVGLPQGVSHARPENWLVKQDESPDWRLKIANGFETAAALAGCGLLDYAQEAPLECFLSSPAPARPAASPKQAEIENPLEMHVTSAVLSVDPVMTITSIQYNTSPLAAVMATATGIFGDRKGLHFLRPSWTMERGSLSELAQAVTAAESANPGQVFVALHASDKEEEKYRAHGIRSILGNSNIFADERIWAEDAPPPPGLEPADAIYIARLASWKNHRLAARLDRPLFVYGRRDLLENPGLLDDYRAQLPTAQFVNHLLGDGSHLQLTHEDIAKVMSCARVGLALSQVEGVMRASMECLLSGLPLVTVPSIGGRDAFLSASNSVIVDATPEAVAAGVAEMVARRLTRNEVRRATMDLVKTARRSFLEEANRVAQGHLGPQAPPVTMGPLVGHINRYRPLRDVLGGLR
ncbi:hypothetical protein [Rhodobacter sp. SY28-1]|uniref:hypothetical protein n=1 Tax=Rhodobacter sp. SY28-1 TaxID=2562317 RepID=UPI0010C0B914|nr:hypothetical protein [Rhodobacter sp. SY28-1]